MKTALNAIAWTFVSLVIIYSAANPDNGVMYQSPMATAGIALIGLGLCKQGLYRRPRRPA